MVLCLISVYWRRYDAFRIILILMGILMSIGMMRFLRNGISGEHKCWCLRWFKNWDIYFCGYFTQNGLVKDFGGNSSDGVNPNYSYRRFNYRTNLDFDVTDNFNMRLDVSSRFMDINEPYNMNVTGIFMISLRCTLIRLHFWIPDGSFAYLYDTQDRNRHWTHGWQMKDINAY